MQIKVNKEDLITILRKNREEHAALYQTAIEKYRERSLEWFNAQIDLLQAGKEVQRTLPLPIPEEHTADFDRTIGMLMMDINADLELEEHEYRQYVDNEWGWARTFTSNTASYTNG
jgi:hypothetical protein